MATTVPAKVGEEVLEPRHALGVQVVRRLVQQQHVGLLEQDAAERHAALLTARERRHVGVGRRQPQRIHRHLDLVVEVPQVRVVDLVLHLGLLVEELLHRLVAHRLGEGHGDLVEAVEQVALLLHCQLDVPLHGERRVELRLLREVADLRPLRAQASPFQSLSTPAMMRSRDDFPAPLLPSTPILAPGIEGDPDVVEDDARRRDHLGQRLHDVDELRSHCFRDGGRETGTRTARLKHAASTGCGI
jgi:hypothetical protein